jgi:hypothetical protein
VSLGLSRAGTETTCYGLGHGRRITGGNGNDPTRPFRADSARGVNRRIPKRRPASRERGATEMTGAERIAALDERFIGIYEAARRRLLDEQLARALVLIKDDQLLLYRGGGEPAVMTGLRPPAYETLKALGHISLAIYCLLVGRTDDGHALAPAVLSALADYRRQVAVAAADLDVAKEVATGVLSRHVDLLARALAFLDRVVAAERAPEAELVAFSRANLADIGVIFAAAARAQLDACHAHMMHLKDNMLSAEDWASLRVVIMGPHMARRDQNFMQYFSRLLHTPMEADKRVVYYEGEDIQGALDLMGTAMLDFRASQSIFGDETRLHRDILADATTLYLNTLLPA